MESNHLTQEQVTIQESLARDSMRIELCKSVNETFAKASDIAQALTRLSFLVFPNDSKVRQDWLIKHPVLVLMAYKLKGMILTNPDIGYLKAKAQVEDMANVL